MADTSKDDAQGDKILKEIARFLYIPEVQKHLSTLLEELKEQYGAGIDQYPLINRKESPRRMYTTEFIEGLSKSKTYFFDLVKEEDQKGVAWIVKNLNLEDGAEKESIKKILFEFVKKIDKHEISPNLIQSEVIELSDRDKADKYYKIGFTKHSSTRVVGFIKEHEEKKEVDDFVIQDDSKILKITNKYKNLEKEEMYTKIKQEMQNHPELIEDIFFYTFMVLKPGEISTI
jgi:succinate dehydrogenase flavin-adding protein (antitoxin of CptAB toxin-antitoxin module)